MAVSRQQLDEALVLHANLATRYKQYETTDGELPPIVVLNEMRYALRAAVKLLGYASFEHLDQVDLGAYEEASQEFHHALRNAYHDLVDGIVIQISVLMDKLLEEYPLATANMLGERRMSILEDLNLVEKAMAESRGAGQQRNQIYEVKIYDEWFEKIVEHYRFVDQVAIPRIISEHDRLEKEKESQAREKEEERESQRRADQANRRHFILQVSLTVLGIIVAIIIGVLKIVGG